MPNTLNLDENGVKTVAELAAAAVDATTRWTVVNGIPMGISPLTDLRPKEAEPRPLKVATLSGVIDYLAADVDVVGPGLVIIHVAAHDTVHVCGPLHGDFNQRFTYLTATAPTPGFAFGQWLPQDKFVTEAQALFLPRPDLARLLRVAGTIEDNQTSVRKDDGVTQIVTASDGVALGAREEVRNPFVLFPFRTFTEVEQPGSPFILRVQNGPVRLSLHEADGGAWRGEAIRNVAEYLREKLPEPYRSRVIA
jgi:hypothetical protein